MRKVIITGVGVLIIGLGYFGLKKMSASKVAPEKVTEKIVNSVYSDQVKNKKIPISIETSGSVLAKDRMVIYSEVQGVFLSTSKAFKAGTKYRKGENLIRIDNDEYIASVVAQRSTFKNLINSILVDIKFDYPTALSKWESYLTSIDITKNLPELPKVENEQEKKYITSKTIFSTFYSINNLEVRLKKYSIQAPYNGTLVESLVNHGTLISPSQKLGTFIKEGVFELELNVNASLQEHLKLNTIVELTNIEKTKSFEGKVIRVNPQIERTSQTIKVFVEIKSSELKEGEYLEANLYAKDVDKGIEIPRSLLINNNSIYIIVDKKLKLIPVNIVFEKSNSVIIKDLEDGVEYISKPITGAFEGMTVKVINE